MPKMEELVLEEDLELQELICSLGNHSRLETVADRALVANNSNKMISF